MLKIFRVRNNNSVKYYDFKTDKGEPCMTDQARLANVFASALEIPVNEIKDDLKYNQDKRWDSTAHMILIAQLEAEFEVMFDIDDIIDMSSFMQAKLILKKYNPDFSF